MSDQNEYTDSEGRRFYYDRGKRVYVDGGKDTGASVAFTPSQGVEGFTRRGPGWYRNDPVATAYGSFDVELLSGKPDEQMVKLALGAASLVEHNIEQVVDIVFAHYQRAVEEMGADFVEDLGMPKKVDRQSILSCIPERAISVDRLEDDDYVCSVSFDIPYDPEHGLQLRITDGQIASINGSEFRIDDGRLYYKWE